MEDKIKKLMKFYLLATKLKYKIRAGWDKDGWNVKAERIESIAEHVYGVCILAISIDSEFDMKIDIERVIKMLVLHEIGETIIGDITPFDGVSIDEKNNIEHDAWKKLLNGLIKEEEYYDLLIEFDERKTNDAKFAYLCDKLEADIQAKVYQSMGCQRSLDDQGTNKCYKYPRIKEILASGAETAFDVWYENDKSKFQDNEVFKKVLEYVKNNDMKV